MSNAKHQDLQLVPEAVLKRRHNLDSLKAKRAAQPKRGNNKVFSASRKVIKVKKPQSFLAQARSRRNHEVRYQRVMRKGMQKRASNSVVEKTKTIESASGEAAPKEFTYKANSVGAKLVFVVRIRDNLGIPSSVKRVLRNLRLNHSNEGVFCRYNESTRKMLHLVEPFVTYGVPSKAIIADLIHRRGHGRVDGERVPLSDNTILEDNLGNDTGIICVEDLVYELHSVGPAFTKANAFLCPFRLAAKQSKFQKQKLNYHEGGDYGDRGEEMNDLIKQLL